MNPLLLSVGAEGGAALQALAHNGLASHAQEWHREWQRAQARAWLHATPEPGVPPDSPRASDGGALEHLGTDAAGSDFLAALQHPVVQVVQAAQGVQLVQPPPASATNGVVAVASYAPSTPQGFLASNEHAPAEHPLQPEIASGGSPSTKQAPCERETVYRKLAGAHESRTEKDTLRLHVESTDEGLRVWIGADGDAATVAARAAAILTELRRSGQHVPSLPLASVVCNGRTLYASGSRAAFLPENTP